MKRSSVAALAVIAVGVAVAGFRAAKAASDPVHVNRPTYHRAEWWVLSARCTQLTGAWLAVCTPDGKLLPIEDISPFDDRGHTVLANAIAAFKRSPFVRGDLVTINLALNAFGCFLFAFYLWMAGLRWGAAAAVWTSLYGIPGPTLSADVTGAFIGCFALSLVAGTFFFVRVAPGRRTLYLALAVIAGVSLSASLMIRQALGLVGVAVLWTALVVQLLRPERSRRWKIAAFLYVLVVSVIALKATSVALWTRGQLWPVPAGRFHESHGIAHPLYQGLGTEPNPWGIVYADDAVGYRHVAQRDPNAGFGTPEYLKGARSLYLDILRQEPLAVLRIYLHKAVRCVQAPFRVVGIPAFWLWGIALLIWLTWRFRERLRGSWLDDTLIVPLAGNLFLLGEGVLVSPEAMFLYPVKVGIAVFTAGLVERLIEGFCRDRSSPARDTAAVV
jgi:hypothetical protein